MFGQKHDADGTVSTLRISETFDAGAEEEKCKETDAFVTLTHKISTYFIIFSYSVSLPLESLQRRYIMEASTLAGLHVFGSFSNEITDNNMVLKTEIKTDIRSMFQ